jgi:hypothetical protein
LLATLVTASPARAEPGEGLLSSTTFALSGGGTIPQTRDLDPGTHVSAVILYETSFGLTFGPEVGVSHSNDPLRTRIAMAGIQARLSPEPDYHVAYIIVGFGAYSVSYDPKDAGVVTPEEKVRPGGSFGFGLEPFRWGNVSLGATGIYQGVIINRGDKIGYVAAAVTLTWRPNRL